MLLVYVILVVWLAVLAHLIAIGQVGWPFVALSFVIWDLILIILMDTAHEGEP